MGLYRCVLRNKEGSLLMEKYSEDIGEADLTWSCGSVEILKKGGSITFTYIDELGRVETEDGFI